MRRAWIAFEVLTAVALVTLTAAEFAARPRDLWVLALFAGGWLLAVAADRRRRRGR